MIKGRKHLNRVLALLLALAVLGGAVLFHLRTLEDRSNQNVSVIMEYYDLVMLQDEGDMSSLVMKLYLSGLNAVVYADDPGTFAQDSSFPGVVRGYSPIYMDDTQDFIRQYNAAKCAFPLVMSYSLPEGSGAALDKAGMSVALRYDLESGKTTTPENFDPETCDSLLITSAPHALDSADGTYDFSESVGLVAQAVNTQGVRAVIISPIIDSTSGVVTDIQVYEDYIRQLVEKLNTLGYDTGSNFYSPYQRQSWSSIPKLLLYLGICVVMVLFINSFKPLKQWISFLILAVLAAGAAVGCFLAQDITGSIMSVLARIFTPCLAFSVLLRNAGRLSRSNGNYGMGYAISYSCFITAVAGVITIAGELSANLLTLDADAFSGLESFRLSFLVSAVIAVYVICMTFMTLYKTGDASVGEHIGGLFYNLRAHAARTLAIILAVVLLVILYILSLNSYFDSLGAILGNMWYDLVGAYPRALQYFISYPCMALGLLLCARRMKGGAWPLILVSTATVFSLHGVFSTALEPITRDLFSAVLSLVLGIVVSVVVCAAATVIIRGIKLDHSSNTGAWWDKN